MADSLEQLRSCQILQSDLIERETAMNYNLAHYNSTEFNGMVLITNDLGNYCFLNHADFGMMVSGQLSSDTETFNTLEDLGFVYLDCDQYIYDFESEMSQMKHCLLVGTQLFIIVLTDACNQRCIYCQAGEVHTCKTSVETCRKAIDIAVQSPVSQVTIEFQGGEPTLNPEALYFSIPYAKRVFLERGKKVEFAIVTNLTNPNPELLRWLIEQDVHISTSLDGSRIVHNYNRPLAIDKSSYDAWHRGAELYKSLCVECGKVPMVSAIQTTTRKSLQYPNEILEEYLTNGMNRLYVRPLTPLGCAKDRWNEIGYAPEEYLSFYCCLIDAMIEMCKNGVDVSETTASIYLARILYGDSVGHTEFRSPCGAGVGQMAINFDGNVYTCDEGRMIANMGDPIFRMGTVDDSYRDLMQSPVVHAVCTASCIEGLPFCSDCVYAPFCAVCPVVNYGIEGDLISRDEHSYRCQISKGIIKYIFEKIQKNDPIEINILRQWADNI